MRRKSDRHIQKKEDSHSTLCTEHDNEHLDAVINLLYRDHQVYDHYNLRSENKTKKKEKKY